MGAAPPVRGLKPVEQTARRYAAQLLRRLALDEARHRIDLADEHPAVAAARCGLLSLTGDADGEPTLCPAPLAACADGALAALAALASPGALGDLRGSQLLTERAAFTGHTRQGAVSPNGHCRLLLTLDGMIAVNLARPDDWDLLPAWLEQDGATDWSSLTARLRTRDSAYWVERGRVLGLAVACASDAGDQGDSQRRGQRRESDPTAVSINSGSMRASPVVEPADAQRPLVVDLSSLWAGPLCSHLLQRVGAEVVKVESLHRPDGARRGSPAFFDCLNAGKRSVTLDFGSPQGRAALLALLERADIVIEASRPRALRQLGIDAPALLAAHPRKTWISITGHGRSAPQADWIAYGDDAGVAAGLSKLLFQASGRWLICGDAIADPLAGLHAALAAWAGWRRGGGGMIDLTLVQVVRDCAGFEATDAPQRRWGEWNARVRDHGPSQAPVARPCTEAAAVFGADTDAVFRELCIPC